MKLIKACIAMAAFAAFLVVPSIASATSPTLFETSGPANNLVPINTNIVATNVAEPSTGSSTTFLKSGVGNIECETATVTGKLIKNTGGVIEGEVTTAEFRGNPDDANPHAEASIHCRGGFGGKTTVTPSHASDETGSLPWCMKATKEDKLEVRGGKCGEAEKALTFRLHTATLGTCSYHRPVAGGGAGTGPVIGTYTTHPADAVATINGGTNANFTRTSGSIFCPSTGELFMSFTLTTDSGNHATNAPLNVT